MTNHSIKNSSLVAFIVPCLVFPFLYKLSLIVSISVCLLLTSSLFIITYRKFIFKSEEIEIEKYLLFFKKNIIVKYEDIDHVYFYFSARVEHNLNIYLKSRKKESITFKNTDFDPIYCLLKSRKIKLETNDVNQLKK
ncbi:MAG: hypothetical protein K0S32_637 [Bacteroidetes bacterium]|jgi:hypothetical protein|nr:hypothetical protein [Bacteroidota bacterium]